jgi:hypothetical protein
MTNDTTPTPRFQSRWEQAEYNRQKEVGYHLRCIERALEDAQSCIAGETPEDCSAEEAASDTMAAVRQALLKHLPEIRKEIPNG